ncbi:sulfurtransferase TusA family protein [Maritimibacter sp. DP1N21-5]|uniref:sulfurtransferase TusA family protein n=1 Tax=Maritimibacter sp. DP1N21-5 TaxID=2836867 RepID=UPI001C441C7D|nr:sulfurtransferase TusA family protein [Maritimibacter sp. DP1N21-5]MBV7409748.1 sulfurtransferase TusA family protein [Maritimibacter sp. DP1N21-5]
MDVTQEIDAIGLLCPWPVLKAQKALRDLATGEVLCLMATDPVAFIDVPHFCTEEGHVLLDVEEDGSSVRYFIQKG